MNWRVDFRREILAQSSLSHPNIASIKAICIEPISFAVEFCGQGELYKLLHSQELRYGWKFLLKIALDVAEALKYMQVRGGLIIFLLIIFI